MIERCTAESFRIRPCCFESLLGCTGRENAVVSRGKIRYTMTEREWPEEVSAMCISIIIPVYNGESTLARCLDSVLAQTFGDFQTIVVDDGSTDGTLAVAQGYVRADARFAVTSITHGGPGAARNRGLELAKGDYVVYMDADDYWACNNLLEELNDRIRKMPADVYMYQMAKVQENGQVLERYTKPPFTKADQVQSLDDVYQDLVRDGHTLAAAWNKCVRREMMVDHGICFREDVLCEDIDWVLQLFSCADTICLMNLRAYAYTQHRTVSRSTQSDAPNDLVAIMADWISRILKDHVTRTDAVAGVLAFEYGICMGNHHLLSRENKSWMRQSIQLLDRGLDRKTLLIRKFCKIFGYHLTCAAVRLYLTLRRIW